MDSNITLKVILGDEFANEIKQLVKSTVDDYEDFVRQEDIEDFAKNSEINTMIDEALDELDLSDRITDATNGMDWADIIKDAIDEGDFLKSIDELITKKLTEHGSELRNLIGQMVDHRVKQSEQQKEMTISDSTKQLNESMKAVSTIFDDLRKVLFNDQYIR